jgi:hypothetical protein
MLALKSIISGFQSFFLILLLSSCSSFFVIRDDEAKWIRRHYKCSKPGLIKEVFEAHVTPYDRWGYVRVGSSGKKYYGHWNGGTLQMFTPIQKDAKSPWLSYSRTGEADVQLWEGMNSWEGGDAKGLKCIPLD